ncbi:Proteinaceous RNase P 2 [Chlorella vulgaris]
MLHCWRLMLSRCTNLPRPLVPFLATAKPNSNPHIQPAVSRLLHSAFASSSFSSAWPLPPATQPSLAPRKRTARIGRRSANPPGTSAGTVRHMQPAIKKQRVEEEGGGTEPKTSQHPKQQQQQQRTKSKKAPTPEVEARSAIHAATKNNDLAAALAVYDRCQADGVKLSAELYVSLLYLCSGGEGWEAQLGRGAAALQQPDSAAAATTAAPAAADGNAVAAQATGGSEAAVAAQEQASEAAAAGASPSSLKQQGQQQQQQQQQPLDPAEVRQRAQQFFEELKKFGGARAPKEMSYTALARMAAAGGDADGAFALVQEMLAAGITPKLRSFTPALVAYAEAGNCDKAFEVDAAITAQHLDLGEPEFCRLLQAAAAGTSWQRAQGVLQRIGSELTVLQPATLDLVRALFASPAAAAADADSTSPASAAGSRWEVAPTTLSAEGVCATCGGKLAALDLSAEELVAFSQGIASIAERMEKRPNDFQQFKGWLQRHGPFGAVVDGANVALYGQNFASGGFSFAQLDTLFQHLDSKHPDLKPLLLLNIGRTRALQARTPAAQALMKRLTDNHSFYVAPHGSNDDWYWIYAAVMAGEQGLLVSNDEMRDHIFQLLAPKYFLKWKQRHQLRYHFGPEGLSLKYPAPYTTCTQQLACGSWVFPGSDGSWLCARRVPSGETDR